MQLQNGRLFQLAGCMPYAAAGLCIVKLSPTRLFHARTKQDEQPYVLPCVVEAEKRVIAQPPNKVCS